MKNPAASSGVSKSRRLGESQAQQAAGNITPSEFKMSGLYTLGKIFLRDRKITPIFHRRWNDE
jgi:hypothetical protein